MRTIKNISQLAGIGCIAWALYTAWHSLPVRDAILTSLTSLTTVEGPGNDTMVMQVAREMPTALVSSPWLLLGLAFVLIPYLAQMLAKYLEQSQPHGRY